jgi:NAD(P)-dependent dehydrogenase (short-subunit alcohol dehydrogenase family)/pimeloyl-ACP methyl ester carboxylesterase
MDARRTVQSGAVTLAVFEQGDPDRPTVLLVHGYPDNHTMWDGVASRLAERFHVVTYDVRGAGESSRPRAKEQYRLEYLAADLFAVADAVSPAQPVHVVAHDWGSIQAWEAVTSPAASARIASYTTMSGPCLDHIGAWSRRRLARPTPRNVWRVVNQQFHSWYILFFHIPFLSALVWRLGAAKVVARIEGLPHAPDVSDAVHGMKLYRANIFQRVGAPRTRRTDVPVQVIIPTGDRYVTPALLEDLPLWVTKLWRRKVIGRHWVASRKPAVIARMVDEFVSHISGAPATQSLRRAEVRPDRREFEDKLVVITGAGSGIGRATALEFASRGASVIVTDIDLPSASETASLIGATAYQLDVADEPAVRQLAERVAQEHGVPDVVVNNAGIGMAGPFTKTSTKDWQRVLDVNLLGVVHCCQAFGDLMVEAAEGGHIVNIASAAAYTPSRVFPAYATSKAAVLMLSECLRAELVSHGIGVSAICPGIVDTGITRSATFAGVSPEDQEKLRERAAKAYRRRNFPPSKVAREIVAAVRDNRAVVPVTVEAKAGRLGSRFAPAIMRRLARIKVGQ